MPASDPYAQQPEGNPHAENRSLVARFHQELAATRKLSRDRRKKNEHNRRIIAMLLRNVEAMGGEEALTNNTNIIYSTLRSMMPHFYAQNPEVSVRPQESVDLSAEPWAKGFSETLGRLINKEFADGSLVEAAERFIAGAFVTGAPMLKVTFQRDSRTDPLIQHKDQDTQEDVIALEGEIERLERPELQQEEKARGELVDEHVTALQETNEAIASSGLRFDYVPFENYECSRNTYQRCDYLQAHWIAQRLFMTREEAEDTFGQEFKNATVYSPEDQTNAERDFYGERSDGDAESTTGQMPKAAHNDLLAIWEWWHKRHHRVFTLVEGYRQDWARPPYTPDVLGQRFYPFFLYEPFPVDGQYYPLDMVDLLRALQAEFQQCRTQQSQHRELSKPHWVGDSSVDLASIRRFEDALIGDITLMDFGGRDVKQLIQAAPIPTLNPAMYDTNVILSDVELISGLSDAARGSVRRAKTATEAEIQDEGLSARTSHDQSRVDRIFSALAIYSAEILTGELSQEEVLRKAGAAATWPQLTRAEAFEKVLVDVRAGSSGKPDKAREQRVWIELIPQLVPMIDKIRQLQQMGMGAAPEIEIIRETFKRFDERVDVEKFIPDVLPLPQVIDPATGQPMPVTPAEQMGVPQAASGGVVPFPGGGQPAANQAAPPGAGAAAPPQPTQFPPR